MIAELEPLIDKVWRHCESAGTRGRTVTIKVKFADFEIITRSRSVSSAVANRDDLAEVTIGLLQDNMPFPKPVRLFWGCHCRPCRSEVVRGRSRISAFDPE